MPLFMPPAPSLAIGHADYANTNPAQNMVADTDTQLLNNAGVVYDEELPAGIGALFANDKIVGIDRFRFHLETELYFTPDDETATSLDVWVNIGGSVGELYRYDFALRKGALMQHSIPYKIANGYMRDTFRANGGKLFARCDGPGTVLLKRVVIGVSRGRIR